MNQNEQSLRADCPDEKELQTMSSMCGRIRISVEDGLNAQNRLAVAYSAAMGTRIGDGLAVLAINGKFERDTVDQGFTVIWKDFEHPLCLLPSFWFWTAKSARRRGMPNPRQ